MNIAYHQIRMPDCSGLQSSLLFSLILFAYARVKLYHNCSYFVFR